MVLEVSKTAPQAAFGAKCNATCFDYSKTGARPKSSPQGGSNKSAQQSSSSKDKNGAWGPVFKNKKNFVDMHMF